MRDVAGIIRVHGDSLDRTYVERWVDELQLTAFWERALALAGE